ncbi:MAG: tetratricopeptide repeat protein [Cyclobacteriaceae bacterium]|nr:tetratricopeptide repeat protein [Cyclobacteriaceae bacterium]
MKYVWLLLIFSASTVFAQDVKELINEGIKFHDQGDYEKAIEKYKEAIQQDSNSAMAYYEMAFSYHLLKEYEQSLESANQALALNDQGVNYYATIIKGSVLDDMGRTQESVSFYKEAVKKYPDQYLLLFNYGVSCGRLGLRSDAQELFLKAIALKPNHPGSHLRLALLKKDGNEKVRATLGLYFFLLLENESKRAEEYAQTLLDWLYQTNVGDDGINRISITLPSGSKKDNMMATAELGFSMALLASSEIEKQKSMSKQEKFIYDTNQIFSLLGELNDNKKNKKKRNAPDLLWDTYVPFFYSIKKAGHTEAFCYHILKTSKDSDIKTWLASNTEKLELFYLWTETH